MIESTLEMPAEASVGVSNAGTATTDHADVPLSGELLGKINAYWRAANYLSVGQIYLYDNPLLKEPLKLSHVKPLVVGHWGTTPGLNFIYAHMNRVIGESRHERESQLHSRATAQSRNLPAPIKALACGQLDRIRCANLQIFRLAHQVEHVRD